MSFVLLIVSRCGTHSRLDVARMLRISMPSLFALTLVLSSCALMTDTPPAVDVLAVRLVGFGLTEQQLAVTLCVTNPNNNEISFRQVTANFDVSGAPLASGRSEVAVQLPPQVSTVVPFTVIATAQSLGPQLFSILRTGSIDYRVHGTVTFHGFGITLPYSRTGHLDPLTAGLELASSASDPVLTRCSLPAR